MRRLFLQSPRHLFQTLSSLRPPLSCSCFVNATAAWGICFFAHARKKQIPRAARTTRQATNRVMAARGMTVSKWEAWFP